MLTHQGPLGCWGGGLCHQWWLSFCVQWFSEETNLGIPQGIVHLWFDLSQIGWMMHPNNGCIEFVCCCFLYGILKHPFVFITNFSYINFLVVDKCQASSWLTCPVGNWNSEWTIIQWCTALPSFFIWFNTKPSFSQNTQVNSIITYILMKSQVFIFCWMDINCSNSYFWVEESLLLDILMLFRLDKSAYLGFCCFLLLTPVLHPHLLLL